MSLYVKVKASDGSARRIPPPRAQVGPKIAKHAGYARDLSSEVCSNAFPLKCGAVVPQGRTRTWSKNYATDCLGKLTCS